MKHITTNHSVNLKFASREVNLSKIVNLVFAPFCNGGRLLKNNLLSLFIAVVAFATNGYGQVAVPFNYTGADQTWTVPAGVTQVTVHAWGAGGAGGDNANSATTTGGGGGYVTGILNVTPGENLTIIVGGQGRYGANAGINSYGGGGKGGSKAINTRGCDCTGGGGGRSAIRRGTTELATAGGGGGGGESRSSGNRGGNGGAGGGTLGNPGGSDSYTGTGTARGLGGTTTAGGARGTGSGVAATAGTQHQGGQGGTDNSSDNSYRDGGGGGGGHYGGGGGGATGQSGAGGGGGSSYIGGITTASTTAGNWQTAGNATHAHNNNTYGRGGNVSNAGQHGRVVIEYPPAYSADITNVNFGSSSWCAGETRNVSVTIKNTGTKTWNTDYPTNVGIKWSVNGSNWTDYHVRVSAGNLAPGQQQTYTLSLTAKEATGGPTYGADITTGTRTISVDIVNEGNCWFGGNGGACGPGNVTYVSPAITIKQPPTVNAGSDVSSCGGNVNLNGSFSEGTVTMPSYGASNASYTSDSYISNVTLNSVSTSSSSDASYTNNTSVVINLNQGTTYSISISTADNSGTSYTHGVSAYIDWNADGDFLDAGELIGTTNGEVGVGTRSFSFTSPFPISSGPRMLRVVADESANVPSSVGVYSWGETEDYTVNILSGVTISWSGGPIVNGGTTATPTVNPASTTTYTMTATANGCSVTDNVTVSVATPIGNPLAFGNNQWNVYGYNGNSRTLASNTYRGYYIQPNLTGGNLGVATQIFWDDVNSPSSAGNPVNTGNLWNGCSVDNDIHTFVHKRKGFPCGNYAFTMNAWDDVARIIIDGVTIWSCDSWSGGAPSNTTTSTYNCLGTNTFSIPLDANSEVEIQLFENTGGTRLTLDIFPITPNSLASTSTRTCLVSGTNWINFYDVDNKLIASVNPNGNNLGNVKIDSYVGSPQVMQDCTSPTNPLYHTAYMGRTWIMNSALYPAGVNFPANVSVRLPYNDSELAALNSLAVSSTTGNPNDNGASLSNMMLTKITGATENGIANSADCASTIRGINTNSGSGTNIQSIANTQYVDFSIGQFSEFFLHKNFNNSPLPVKLTNFSATCEKVVTLNWTTASEQNSDRFIVEKSRDGQTWSLVATQTAAGNSNTILNYIQTDENNWNGVTYYRLRQIDFNGAEEIYGPISVSCEGNQSSMTVYPNPNSGSFMIEIASTEIYNNAQLFLTDLTGKVITSQTVNVANGTTQILINDLDLKMGTYLVTLRGADQQLKPVKVMVTK